MSSYQWYRVAGVIGCAAVLMAGCASSGPKPTEQIAVSKSAVANAVAAGGSEYAPVEMRTAQDKLDRAHRAMDKERERFVRAEDRKRQEQSPATAPKDC